MTATISYLNKLSAPTQDAHEFLNYLLNQMGESLEAQAKARGGAASSTAPGAPPPPTWVHNIFQGRLVNETRCLRCESISAREEVFMDLSLEIEANSSVTACLRNFRHACSELWLQLEPSLLPHSSRPS